jgi:hypothetical protein
VRPLQRFRLLINRYIVQYRYNIFDFDLEFVIRVKSLKQLHTKTYPIIPNYWEYCLYGKHSSNRLFDEKNSRFGAQAVFLTPLGDPKPSNIKCMARAFFGDRGVFVQKYDSLLT